MIVKEHTKEEETKNKKIKNVVAIALWILKSNAGLCAIENLQKMTKINNKNNKHCVYKYHIMKSSAIITLLFFFPASVIFRENQNIKGP